MGMGGVIDRSVRLGLFLSAALFALINGLVYLCLHIQYSWPASMAPSFRSLKCRVQYLLSGSWMESARREGDMPAV